MLPLPTELPQWYTVEPTEEKGWTPKTSDILEKPENQDIIQAWKGTFEPNPSHTYTIRLDKLQVISPIQVGGGSFPEGGILPAQISGVPYIPGSSVRGAFLHWLQVKWQDLSTAEQEFWSTLLTANRQSWQPRTIRFESIRLKNLKPFPLNPQQSWQVFNQKSNKLGIQWQVSPHHPPRPSPDRFCLQVLLKDNPTVEQKSWLENRLTEMLQEQGLGRGTASGFGRLAKSVPSGQWELQLTGMKPGVQPHSPKDKQIGKYRWSPQVLRANLRGYFTRLALYLLNCDRAEKLTSIIFGGLGCPAQLTLTSYLAQVVKPRPGDIPSNSYTNIPAQVADQTWRISVNCNSPFQDLVGGLLDLASRLGGMGPGWRRPPHQLERFNGFRGSEFTVTPANSEQPLNELINYLKDVIRNLAQRYGLRLLPNPVSVPGSIISIWRGKSDQWCDIVHGVCSTTAKNRPDWCGNTQNRPSGYAVRHYESYCLITVFDSRVEATLRQQGFQSIWSGIG
jgi:hypothetical protein